MVEKCTENQGENTEVKNLRKLRGKYRSEKSHGFG
jgi:hypothetical protein